MIISCDKHRELQWKCVCVCVIARNKHQSQVIITLAIRETLNGRPACFTPHWVYWLSLLGLSLFIGLIHSTHREITNDGKFIHRRWFIDCHSVNQRCRLALTLYTYIYIHVYVYWIEREATANKTCLWEGEKIIIISNYFATQELTIENFAKKCLKRDTQNQQLALFWHNSGSLSDTGSSALNNWHNKHQSLIVRQYAHDITGRGVDRAAKFITRIDDGWLSISGFN